MPPGVARLLHDLNAWSGPFVEGQERLCSIEPHCLSGSLAYQMTSAQSSRVGPLSTPSTERPSQGNRSDAERFVHFPKRCAASQSIHHQLWRLDLTSISNFVIIDL